MLYHNEPIIRDGNIVGFLTSGNFGHTLGASVGLGYVYDDAAIDQSVLDGSSWHIEVGGVRIPATASLRGMYDPKGERMRG